MSVLDRWYHKVHEIPRAGVTQHRQASPELREELAADLDIPACNSLVADYRIQNAGKGRFELTGRVKAALMRTCIVTLEPVPEDIDEPLDCTFLPPEQIPNNQAEEEEALAVEEIEAIRHDRLEVGRVIYEVVAASMDPYPRTANAELEDATEGQAEDQSSEHPFAALSRLKNPKRD